MHPLLQNITAVESSTIFFKHTKSNVFRPPTRKEERLLVDLVQGLNPSLVCLSLLSPHVPIGRRLTRLIRAACPKTLVAWGGTHPTVSPETCIREADIVCRGEGEEALADLVTCLRDGRSYDGINNLWINKEGAVRENPLRPLITDLDSLPFPAYDSPAFYTIESGRMTRGAPMAAFGNTTLTIQSTRGCAFACSFCVNGTLRALYKGLGPFIRRRSVDNIIKEIQEKIILSGNRFRLIAFADDHFAMEEPWLDEFAAKYRDRVALPFVATYHPWAVNPTAIRKLKAAGVQKIFSGLQCGSEKIRKALFCRPGENNDIVSLAEEAFHQGVDVEFDVILDNPFETAGMVKETIDLLLQLPRPRRLRYFSMTFFPEYPLTQKAFAQKVIHPRKNPEDILHERWAKRWSYVPRLVPVSRKTILQNIAWLVGRNSVTDAIIHRAVSGRSFSAKACLLGLNIRAFVSGKIWGVGGLIERDALLIRWPKYVYYGLKYLAHGEHGLFYKKVRKHMLLFHRSEACGLRGKSIPDG